MSFYLSQAKLLMVMTAISYCSCATVPAAMGQAPVDDFSKHRVMQSDGKLYQTSLLRDMDGPLENEGISDASYHFRMTRMVNAWSFNDAIRSNGSSLVPVAVLDVGFANHRNLQFATALGQTKSDNAQLQKHGTFVSSVIAANDEQIFVGATPFARLFPYTLSADKPQSLKDLFQGLSYTLGEISKTARVTGEESTGIRVVNVSLGSNWSRFDREGDEYRKQRQQLMSTASEMAATISSLRSHGVIVVVAAGNDQEEAFWSTPISCLADQAEFGTQYDNVLIVESCRPVGEQGYSISPFSNVGGHVSAPGERILGLSPVDQFYQEQDCYAVMSGTAMAAPQVTALIAHLYAYNPALKFSEVIDLLKSPPGRLKKEGNVAPLIDAFDAMVRSKPNSWHDLANLSSRDDSIDMDDLAVFVKHLRRYQDGDRCSVEVLRADLNGDGKVSVTEKAPMWDFRTNEYVFASDLDVIAAVWDDHAAITAGQLTSWVESR